MCGLLLVYKNNNNVAKAGKKTESLYQLQKERGQEGFGYLSIDKEMLVAYERAATEGAILSRLRKDKSDMILFHHRHPTSTENLMEAAHPILVSHESLVFDYYVAHNGIISNAAELKLEHEKEKFVYTTTVETLYKTKVQTYYGETFNDSEALAIDLAKAIEEERIYSNARGSVAFICAQVDKKTKKVNAIYFGRNIYNPLYLLNYGGHFTLASQVGGEMVEENKLFKMDLKDNYPIKSTPFHIPTTVPTPKTSYYSHLDEEEEAYYNQKWATDLGIDSKELALEEGNRAYLIELRAEVYSLRAELALAIDKKDRKEIHQLQAAINANLAEIDAVENIADERAEKDVTPKQLPSGMWNAQGV